MNRRTLLVVTTLLMALAFLAAGTAVLVLPDGEVGPSAPVAGDPSTSDGASAGRPDALAQGAGAPGAGDGGRAGRDDGERPGRAPPAGGERDVLDAEDDEAWTELGPEELEAELLEEERLERLARRARAAVQPGLVIVRWNGAGLPGARVRVFPLVPEGSALERGGGAPLADLRTAADGTAALPSTLPQDESLLALIQAEGLAGTVETLSPDEGLELDLAELSTTVSTVTPDDEPVVTRVRALYGPHVLVEADTDAEGRCTLHVGPFAFEARAADGRVGRAAPGGPGKRFVGAGVRIVLRPGKSGDLRGRVLQGGDQPAAGAVVRATWPGGDGEALAETAPDGTFRLEALPAGRVSLEVWPDGRAEGVAPDAVASALVDPARENDVLLRLAGPGELEVQVVDGGRALSDARVFVVDPAVTRYGDFAASGAQQEGVTGADGRARFSVPPGRWNLRVRAPEDDRVAVASALVEAGTPARVVVDVGRQRTLKVRVVDPARRPVQGVFMDASMPGLQWQDMPAARTGADGVATFRALPPGLAELHLGFTTPGSTEQWRMLRTSEDEAEFTWTEPVQVRLDGVLEDGPRDLRVVTVLPDVAKLIGEFGRDGAVNVVPAADGARLDALITTPGGTQDVWLLPADVSLAPVRLGQVGPPPPELRDWRATFPRAASVSGRLVDANGAGVAGSVTIEGPLGGAFAARAQWLSGTANDAWLTVNEWAVGTGPDGLFDLTGLPPGRWTLLLQGVGCAPRRVDVSVDAGARVDLGPLTLS